MHGLACTRHTQCVTCVAFKHTDGPRTAGESTSFATVSHATILPYTLLPRYRALATDINQATWLQHKPQAMLVSPLPTNGMIIVNGVVVNRAGEMGTLTLLACVSLMDRRFP